MMPMGPADVLALRAVVLNHWTAMGLRTWGPAAAGYDQLLIERLVRDGYLTQAAMATVDPVQDQYLLGFYRAKMEQAGHLVDNMPLAEVRDLIARMPTPLQPLELAAVEYAKTWAGQWCQGLGNKVADQVLSLANAEDLGLRARMLDVIGDETATALLKRETIGTLASRLGNATGDWARDWQGIAATEMHNAHEHGVADSIEHDFGADSRVAKLPEPEACEACKALYLEDGRPRIFRLSQLRANGTNAGRKRPAWLATLGPIHKWCRCELVLVPEGFGFNEDLELVPEGA